jgi:hypothetical protein
VGERDSTARRLIYGGCPRRHVIHGALLLILAGAWTTSVVGSGAAIGRRLTASAGPADTITRYYTMTARLRPFGVWIARDNVGGARMSWSASPSADRHLEVLVGSDPERAPMSLNRWGFLAERTADGTTRQTSVMTEIDERAINQALNGAPAPAHAHAFRAVESTVRGNEATTATAYVVLDRDLTYRYYTALLDRLPSGDDTALVRRVRLGSGTEPGFLMAMKDLIHESVTTWQRDGRLAQGAPRRTFVYLGTVYQMTLRHATVVKDQVGGRSVGPAMDGDFEVRNPATGSTSEFRLLCGLEGTDAETPLRIVYRARWWVELELQLVDSGTSKFAKAVSSADAGGPH